MKKIKKNLFLWVCSSLLLATPFVFINYMFKIIIGGQQMGKNYLNIKNHILKNLFYPNVYLSLIYFIFRKIFKILGFKIQ